MKDIDIQDLDLSDIWELLGEMDEKLNVLTKALKEQEAHRLTMLQIGAK